MVWQQKDRLLLVITTTEKPGRSDKVKQNNIISFDNIRKKRHSKTRTRLGALKGRASSLMMSVL